MVTDGGHVSEWRKIMKKDEKQKFTKGEIAISALTGAVLGGSLGFSVYLLAGEMCIRDSHDAQRKGRIAGGDDHVIPGA